VEYNTGKEGFLAGQEDIFMAEQEQPTGHRVSIEWTIPETIKNQPATHIVIQRDGPEYIINFFELRPPLLTGTPEEQATQLAKIETIQGLCIARLIVAAERMPAIAKAFADALELAPPWLQEG
jgi:hypothetical protein